MLVACFCIIITAHSALRNLNEFQNINKNISLKNVLILKLRYRNVLYEVASDIKLQLLFSASFILYRLFLANM